MKKLLSILLVVCLVFIAAACGKTDTGTVSSPETSAPAPATTEVVNAPAVDSAPPPEDAKYAESIVIMNDGVVTPVIDAFSTAGMAAQSSWIYTMITDRLIWYDESTGEFVPELATRWETSDNKTITFYLRDDAFFHNGEKCTAKDVAWTIEISREFPGSQANDRWSSVVETKIIDDYTIQIVLEKANAGFFGLICTPPCGIYNSKAYQEQPDTWTWIGTGPYKVSGFSSNEYVDLTRFDDYWGGPAPTKNVSFRFVPEEAVRPLMMKDNTFQFSLGIIPDDLSLFDGDPDFKLLPRRLNSPISIGFNMTDPITGDLDFRKAVIYALNGYEVGLIGEGERGCSEVKEGGMWGFSTAFRKTDIPRMNQDLDLAKQHLEASSWNGETVRIAAMPGGLGRCAEMIQEQLKQIGIPVEVQIMDQAELFTHCAYGDNKSQMFVFPSIYDNCPFMAIYNNYMPSAMNFTSYTNPRIAELIAQAEGMVSLDDQRAAFHEIQEIVAQDLPHYPMFWKEFVDVARSNVFGYKMSNTSPNHDFRGIYMLMDE